MDDLVKRLERRPALPLRGLTVEPELQIWSGVEDAAPDYRWEGQARGADPAHPFLLFQYTLAGWGSYEDRNGRETVGEGEAFLSIIPSAHRYYRPPASPRWQVFWLIMFHPYIVKRAGERLREHGPLYTVEPAHPLTLRAVELWENHLAFTPYDRIAREQDLFAFLFEYERLVYYRRQRSSGEHLLNEVRQYVLSELQRPIGVDELARWKGMQRSNFSHQFKAATGIAPAPFIQLIRLEEAAHRLINTREPVLQIATETGFANPSHFCRVFRQRFRLSPAAFRRQIS